jgi:transposase InsO family protein
MRTQIEQYVKRCAVCQKAKRGIKGYGKIPIKDVETAPWKDIAVDLAGPWTATIDGKKITFHSLTIIDPFTSWLEIVPILNKTSSHIADLIEQEWLRRYPRPSRIIYDKGGEFANQDFFTLCRKWNCKNEQITTKNPQANAIVERLHRIMGDMLRAQLARKHQHDNPIKELLSSIAYGIRATVHGTTQFTPAQLVFHKDMILRTQMEVDMEMIRNRRQEAIIHNNKRENKRRIKFDYKAGDRILILSGGLDPKLKLHEGPYKVLSYNKSNGILHIQRKGYVEPISIRRVRPFFGKAKA